MNTKIDALCRFFIQGKCDKGEQCKFSHDTQNVEKVDLERNDQGKLVKKNQMRGNQNFRNNVDSDRWERNQNNDEPKQYRGRGRGNQNNDDERRQFQNRNQHFDEDQQNQHKFNKSYDNQDKYQKFNVDNEERKQRNENSLIRGRGSRGRGRGRGQDDEERENDRNEQKDQDNRDDSYRKQIRNDRNDRTERVDRGDRGDRGKNIRNFRNMRQDRQDRNDRVEQNQNEENQQDERQQETQPFQKRVKKNEIEIKKKTNVLKLEQKLECDNFVQIIGYNLNFLGILKKQSIEFYSIPFKRNRMEIIDEDEKVSIIHKDKQFISAWIQEIQINNYTLIVQYEKDGEKTKNLLIFENVFYEQCPIEINDIGLKQLAYVYIDQDQLFTFCKDGFIRIFKQQIDKQYKYILHFNFEQSIESVIQVGSNYLIGARNNKLYIFTGTQAKEIQYKFNQKCTDMKLDYNRVILKLNDELESQIYILTQNLEIIGPIHKTDNFICLEIIKNYENEKLYLLCTNKSIEIFIEIDNKLYSINVLMNKQLQDIKKIEITNENMVTQKYIVGYQQNELCIFSIVPEQ